MSTCIHYAETISTSDGLSREGERGQFGVCGMNTFCALTISLFHLPRRWGGDDSEGISIHTQKPRSHRTTRHGAGSEAQRRSSLGIDARELEPGLRKRRTCTSTPRRFRSCSCAGRRACTSALSRSRRTLASPSFSRPISAHSPQVLLHTRANFPAPKENKAKQQPFAQTPLNAMPALPPFHPLPSSSDGRNTRRTFRELHKKNITLGLKATH